MALASLQMQTQPASGLGSHHTKLTKSRKSIVVKPILKKLHASHSERNSLDMDRGWDEQPSTASPDLEFASLDYGARDLDDFGADRQHLFSPTYTAAPAASQAKPAKTARDVSFKLSATELGGGGASSSSASGPGGGARPNAFSSASHARSTSGASVATTNSGRGGSFVHPFQQTPRTSTPPLHSHANSVSSLDNTLLAQREYSTTIAEGEGDEASLSYAFRSATASKKSPIINSNQPKLRRPSLTSSQRTSSYSDGTSLRATTTTRTNSGPPVLRPTPATVDQSRSEIQPASVSSANDAFFSGGTTPLTLSTQKTSPSICSTSSPISPFRTSLDMNGFRIRSRSEMDTATRQEQVREARRKFEAKEREKEERYAREQVRKRERADAREAQKFERAHAQNRKTSFGHTSTLSSARNSLSNREKTEASPTTPADGAATAEDVHFEMPSRSKTAKRKTNGVWTAFMLWLRTRLLKLGRH